MIPDLLMLLISPSLESEGQGPTVHANATKGPARNLVCTVSSYAASGQGLSPSC